MFPLINQGKDSTVEPGYLAQLENKIPSKPQPEVFEVDVEVSYTSDPETGDPWFNIFTEEVSKTYTEIIAAHNNGKKVVFNYNIVPDPEYAEEFTIKNIWNGDVIFDDFAEHSTKNTTILSCFSCEWEDLTNSYLASYSIDWKNADQYEIPHTQLNLEVIEKN